MTFINRLKSGDFFKYEGEKYLFLGEKDDVTRDFLCFSMLDKFTEQFSGGVEVEKLNVELTEL